MNERIQAVLAKLTELVNSLSGKQDTLIGSGTGQNIKTVNNNSILGSGNIEIEGFSGDYNDLTNAPEPMTTEDVEDAIDEGESITELLEEEIDNGTY